MTARMTPNQVQRIGELREQGLTYEAIGREVGCGKGAVHYWLVPAAREKRREYEARPERKAKKRERNASPEYKAKKREYQASPEYRAKKREYRASPEYKAKQRAYDASPEVKAYQREYNATPERKAWQREYQASPEYKAKAREYRASPEGKVVGLVKSAKRRALKKKVTVGDLTAIARVYDRATNGALVRCYLCDKVIPKGERHVDHIIPLSKDGLHTASNLDIACAQCNLRKSNRLPEEVGLLPLEVTA